MNVHKNQVEMFYSKIIPMNRKHKYYNIIIVHYAMDAHKNQVWMFYCKDV